MVTQDENSARASRGAIKETKVVHSAYILLKWLFYLK